MKLSIVALVALAASNVQAFTMAPSGVAQRTALRMTVEEKEAKEIRVGVIGCGRIGIVHLGAITKAPNVTPVIVSNPTVSKADAGKTYGHMYQHIFVSFFFNDQH